MSINGAGTRRQQTQDLIIRTLRAAGKTYGQIARVLRCHRTAVFWRAWELGIK